MATKTQAKTKYIQHVVQCVSAPTLAKDLSDRSISSSSFILYIIKYIITKENGLGKETNKAL